MSAETDHDFLDVLITPGHGGENRHFEIILQAHHPEISTLICIELAKDIDIWIPEGVEIDSRTLHAIEPPHSHRVSFTHLTHSLKNRFLKGVSSGLTVGVGVCVRMNFQIGCSVPCKPRRDKNLLPRCEGTSRSEIDRQRLIKPLGNSMELVVDLLDGRTTLVLRVAEQQHTLGMDGSDIQIPPGGSDCGDRWLPHTGETLNRLAYSAGLGLLTGTALASRLAAHVLHQQPKVVGDGRVIVTGRERERDTVGVGSQTLDLRNSPGDRADVLRQPFNGFLRGAHAVTTIRTVQALGGGKNDVSGGAMRHGAAHRALRLRDHGVVAHRHGSQIHASQHVHERGLLSTGHGHQMSQDAGMNGSR